MAYKVLKDVMEATGKSYSSVKKWRITIEELSGYEFKKVRKRVSRRCVRDVYEFTEEEFDKFIRLSKRIDETKDLKQSVIDIWGDLKAREEKQLKQDIVDMKSALKALIKADKHKDIIISTLENKIKKMEERLAVLEENKSKGILSKIIK